MRNSTRIIINTGILYGKLLIGLILGLFSTRIILEALGETDYGIYILVGGIIGMLGILNSSMTNASLRFMSFSLGTGDVSILKRTFNTTLVIHIFLGGIVILLMEIGGMILFQWVLDIPVSKVHDAKIVFHIMVFTTLITIISVPYDAVINSHENIFILSIVDVFGYLIKLGIAIFIAHSQANRLIQFSLLILASQILLRSIKQWYSVKKYPECEVNLKSHFDYKVMREIMIFTSWNLFGSIASMSVKHLRGIILNAFFGVSVNASEGISRTASTQVNTISTSMTRAINPQLVKSEGSGNRNRVIRITEISTKYSLFLFSLVAIPIIFEAKYLLNLWLIDVPEYAVIFLQLILINLLIEKLGFEITSAIRAIGDIRALTIMEAILSLISIPISIMVFKSGSPAYSIYLVYIGISIVAFANRLYFGRKIAGMNLYDFFSKGIYPIVFPLTISTILILVAQLYLSDSIVKFIISFMIFGLSFTSLFWSFSLSKSEKSLFLSLIKYKNKGNYIT